MTKKHADPLRMSFATNGFGLDVSRASAHLRGLDELAPAFALVHEQMRAIEAGAVKNPDENRQVTHFTDRATYGASELFADVEAFFADVRSGGLSFDGRPVEAVVINGIGGSTLGPQLAQFALCGPYWNELSREQRGGNPRIYILDNTDPAGLHDLDQVISWDTALVVTISKSGGTREPRNNMLAIEDIFAARGLPFGEHACAVTMAGSKLDQHAEANGWRKRWHMAESIGGRTSETAVVGHVPAAAAGIDFEALLAGAVEMDAWTRAEALAENPAYLLAASWFLLGDGRGDRNMVVLPYSDRLVLLARYLQQLVMESLGKGTDLRGVPTQQGLNVFGNKGGSDAHAFVQQLQEGRDDFFVTFIEVLEDAASYEAEDGLTMGDYLHNFLGGLVGALSSKQRPVLLISIDALTPSALGMLIALYERAVAAYAELVGINAFHQPGVQAYKLASGSLDVLTQELQLTVSSNAGFQGPASEVPGTANADDVAGILAKWAVNGRSFGGVSVQRQDVAGEWQYAFVAEGH